MQGAYSWAGGIENGVGRWSNGEVKWLPTAMMIFLIFSGDSFAQLGMSLEEASKLPDRIGFKKYNKYGEKFVQLTTEDEKGLVLEMDFLNDRCESARWVLRKGKLPADFAQEVWNTNFESEGFVKKGDNTWLGKTGGQLSWGKTYDECEVIWVRSAKYDKIQVAEAKKIVKIKKSNQEGVAEEKTRKRLAQASDDEAEMNDFIGGVYRGGGNVHRAGNVIMTEDGLIFKSGSRFIYQNGDTCQHVGSTYIRDDNSVVVRSGNAFISNDGVTEKVGSNYIGDVNSFPSGSTTLRQGLPSR